MDKIKKMFSPGGDKDDEVMYGTPEPHNIHEDGTSGQGPRGGDPNYPQQDPSGALTRGDMPEAGYASQSQGISTGEGRGDGQPAQLQTDPNVEKKDHGVLRQILQVNAFYRRCSTRLTQLQGTPAVTSTTRCDTAPRLTRISLSTWQRPAPSRLAASVRHRSIRDLGPRIRVASRGRSCKYTRKHATIRPQRYQLTT